MESVISQGSRRKWVAERGEHGSGVGNVVDWSRFGQAKRFRKLAYLDLLSRVITVWVCIMSSVEREHPGKMLSRVY